MQTEATVEQRVRGYIAKVLPGGYAFVKTEDGVECFLHLKDFRRAERSPGCAGQFVSGTFLEFTRQEAHPRPRAVNVKILS